MRLQRSAEDQAAVAPPRKEMRMRDEAERALKQLHIGSPMNANMPAGGTELLFSLCMVHMLAYADIGFGVPPGHARRRWRHRHARCDRCSSARAITLSGAPMPRWAAHLGAPTATWSGWGMVVTV